LAGSVADAWDRIRASGYFVLDVVHDTGDVGERRVVRELGSTNGDGDLKVEAVERCGKRARIWWREAARAVKTNGCAEGAVVAPEVDASDDIDIVDGGRPLREDEVDLVGRLSVWRASSPLPAGALFKPPVCNEKARRFAVVDERLPAFVPLSRSVAAAASISSLSAPDDRVEIADDVVV
jgi:hypothetical protein